MSKTIKNQILVTTLIVFVLGIVYSYRWIFSQTFVPTYFQEFYDHSQWSIPQSPRIMGDGELYQYAGYKLLRGDNPFTVNPEVPPIGKYLYTVAIGLTDNAFIFNLPLYVLALFMLHQLTKKLKFARLESLLAVLLFATSPLLYAQIGDTALDLFHVVTLLLYMVGLLVLSNGSLRTIRQLAESVAISGFKTRLLRLSTIVENSRNDNPKAATSIHESNYALGIVITGIGLGLFIGTKFGLFAIALLPPLIWLLYRQRRLIYLFPIFFLAGTLYLGSYASYFWQGHTLTEWFQTQKWIVNFYLYSQAVKNPMIFLSVIFTGVSAWKEGWQTVAEWTLVWPLAFGSLVLVPLHKKSTQSGKSMYLVGLLLLGTYFIVPFAVRYLLLALPLGIIALIIVFRRLPKPLTTVILIICLFQAGLYLIAGPHREIARINQLLSANRFDDLYFETTKLASPQPGEGGTASTWSEFSLPIHSFIHEIKASSAKFWVTKTPPFGSKDLTFFVTYQTPIGAINFQRPGVLTQSNGKWKLVWDWEYIAPHFDPTATTIYQQGSQLGGTLTSADGKNLSKGILLPYITVIPKNITGEPELLVDIKTITGVDSLATRNMIHVDHPYTLNRRIGFVVPAYDKNIYAKLATHSGILITLENAPESRVYPQGAIDKKYVPIIRELEKVHPRLTNFIQGMIEIQSNNQLYRIYTSPPTVPVDVVLPQTVDQLFGVDAQIVF